MPNAKPAKPVFAVERLQESVAGCGGRVLGVVLIHCAISLSSAARGDPGACAILGGPARRVCAHFAFARVATKNMLPVTEPAQRP